MGSCPGETKSHVWEGFVIRDKVMTDWSSRVRDVSKVDWRYASVNQSALEQVNPSRLVEVLVAVGG
jgi:hypothetical protein